ncbi:MFS transporter [Paenibacillus koleovorans]|uniref:MFS transporter n=1 Tax=Paenibacillus koleovorans TaxID=121608 RepID=UPI000FDC80C7|nr:MFS transporter [Paenibacillus koleovorans]
MGNWKVNLIVLTFGQFLVMAGMTMVIPFLPLYIQELGITDSQEVSVWAGIIFAGNFVTSFFFQPLWGKLADRYGRKVMLLRSGFGMAIVISLMGFSGNVWHLLLLRILNGTIAGYVPASVALMASMAPKHRMGFAMGTLQSGNVAGGILGPLIGGLLAEWVGFRPIFYITGALLFLASVMAWIVVKEKFNATEAAKKPNVSIVEGFKQLGKIPQLMSLFMVTLLIQFAMLSTMPLMALFVQELHGTGQYLAFYAGLVGSITGFSNMISSPLLGRLSDRIGQTKILFVSLIGAGLAFIPQALVHNVWQLFAIRFILGIFIGGLLPTVNALIRKFTPDGMESRSYSFNSSFLSLGNLLGPIVGGTLSGWIGIRGIFYTAAFLLLFNAIWVYKKLLYKKTVQGA